MSKYLGNIKENATVSFTWDTVDSNGASVTRATNGTIKIRRHDDGTDCTGTSITDNEDTPLTGLHECIVDTNDNVNFTPSNDYTIYLEGAVIDGQTINASLACFSIENRYDPITETQVGAQSYSVLSTYDPPTKTEMDSGFSGLNDISEEQVGSQVNFSVSTLPTATQNATELLGTQITALGTDVESVLKNSNGMAKGKILQVGSQYSVFDDDDTSILFTFEKTTTERILV